MSPVRDDGIAVAVEWSTRQVCVQVGSSRRSSSSGSGVLISSASGEVAVKSNNDGVRSSRGFGHAFACQGFCLGPPRELASRDPFACFCFCCSRWWLCPPFWSKDVCTSQKLLLNQALACNSKCSSIAVLATYLALSHGGANLFKPSMS